MRNYNIDLTLRHGDNSLPPVRTPRLVRRDNQWFFQLRDGGVSGPFDDELTAMEAVDEMVQIWKGMRPMLRLIT